MVKLLSFAILQYTFVISDINLYSVQLRQTYNFSRAMRTVSRFGPPNQRRRVLKVGSP